MNTMFISSGLSNHSVHRKRASHRSTGFFARRFLALVFTVVLLASNLCAEDTGDALLQKALHYADLYNWQAARPYFTRAEDLFATAGDKRNELYAQLGAIRAGVDPAPIPDLSYRLAQELATNPILQSDKELRMFCLIVKGDFDEVIDAPAMRRDWVEVAALARELGNTKWQYRAQGQLGFADFYDGNLPGAQRGVGAALMAASTAKDVGAQIFYLSATATGLQSQQMNDQAILYADQAIALSAANPDSGYPIIAQRAKLLAMVQAGRIGAAEVELKKMLAQAQAQNEHYKMTDLNWTAAQVYRAKNDVPAALKYLKEALREAEAGAYRSPVPQIQSDLSDLYRLSGDLAKAEELARSAAESAQAGGYIPLIPPSLHSLAEVQVSQHKYSEADRTYDRAAMIQDMMIGNADNTLGKTALIKAASDLYAKHFALVAEHIGSTEKAFEIIEQVRGRVMTDLLATGINTSPESLQAERKIAHLRLQLTTALSDRDISALRNQIFLAEQLRSAAPELSILKMNLHRSLTLERLQATLSPAEVVLEYILDSPTSYCLVITRERTDIAKLAGKQAISPLVEAYLRQVKARQPAHDEARRLYDVLLDPIPEIQSRRQLIIIRDGQLHLVPFDALLDRQDHYLLESHEAVYAPSATSFFLLRTGARSTNPGHTVLAVGGIPYDHSNLNESAITRGYSGSGLANLPSSRDEALAASAAFPDKSNAVLLGDGATETAFKKSINHSVIHLAVHAIVNETRPDRAALILLADPAHDEDGFLQSSEIVQLPVKADLVVLSACDTAVGPLEGQEGISTLSRAFLLAGARTVVSTLWSVQDDSTLFLMKNFYSELTRNKRATDALSSAKRTMLKRYGAAKAVPFYWAGFTIEGAAEPLTTH